MDHQERLGVIVTAHAQLQAQIFYLTLALAGGYQDTSDPGEVLRRLSRDAQDVIDAAVALKRVVITGGESAKMDGPGA